MKRKEMERRASLITPAGDDNALDLSEALFAAGVWDGKTPIRWPDPWRSWKRFYDAMCDVKGLERGRDYVLGAKR